MDFSSESEISDSEIFEYKEKPYGLLKSGQLKVTRGGSLRCPFYVGRKKQDYKYKDLLQHATGVAPPVQPPAAPQTDRNELFCIPWIGIIVNIMKHSEVKGCVISEEYLMDKPKEVVLFWDGGKLTGEAVVKFENNWTSFGNCLEFERFFESDHRSKKN
ncbi:hypothetical protein POM88_052807 [Heracleum sosnowskyi]|uniref:Uncharacterized protein n=1 Tax=Heracleum sosnowskyi TaxID=360622 RepID=A0AAD8LYL4_9APIA|nr:hypothetical protein POM88_052807 [Heracleum sosnowskyi]